jgi:hypothetical protein
MAWYADLTPCTYFRYGPPITSKLLAVGWLEQGHNYSQAVVDGVVVDKLTQLLGSAWQPGGGYKGFHTCDFCPGAGRPSVFVRYPKVIQLGATNVFIPGEGVIYVAPSLILHYIDDHNYAPPAAFCDAVLACPPMGSDDYFNALQRQFEPVERAYWTVVNRLGDPEPAAWEQLFTLLKEEPERWPLY